MSDGPPSVEGYDSADATFNEALQIDMKGLFGDTVGNMSISPTSRDVVLAGRKGLFIIDLNAPLEIPRFLPQGGTWDVADVQWNPHVSHAQYIVSTSNEKLLIWNLLLDGKMAIQHVLHAHSRAITDINWHTSDPNQVVSTGIDGWLWGWDIRGTTRPVLGLCAFSEAATQVKWNRQNEHVLASSHAEHVLIWDRRKGSIPIHRIPAHSARIYGIDWSHENKTEILSCSLDRTIKLWDVEVSTEEPKVVFNTSYPVWRARDLPFGRGVLSLPQRGENVLDLWSYNHPEAPVSVLEGHSDTVKEFVWRRGGKDYNDFRLITWSKDKTLRFCPVDFGDIPDLSMRECPPNPLSLSNISETSQTSYRSISHPENRAPPLSAPFGYILSEVRAPPPSRRPQVIFPLPSGRYERVKGRSFSRVRRQSAVMGATRGGTMSRGGRSARMDPLAWWSSIKVGDKRDGSSEAGSDVEGGDVSRVHSTSRRSSHSGDREHSGFLGRKSETVPVEPEDESKDADFGQSLQDEITAVISKLSQHKVRLEKHDLTKKRSVTMGLTGPWGESSSVFIRVTFTFPRDYPSSRGPSGTPTVDLERNPLISLNDRAFMLRRLRVIRETHRPCLEACLRFLLFGNEGERLMMSYGSSDNEDPDKEDDVSGRKASSAQRDDVAYSQLRNDKTLAEPRTSQGVFGPNGELICFFRAPPRIVRNPLHEMSASPSLRAQETAPQLFRAPASLSDAIHHLTVASNDRAPPNTLRRAEDPGNILRIMTNLLTFSQGKRRRVSGGSKPANDDAPYALLPTRRSTVFIKPATNIGHPDRIIASQYQTDTSRPGESCRTNASIAKQHGRYDHERIFKTLEILIEGHPTWSTALVRQKRTPGSLGTKLARNIYTELCLEKDVQILAVASVFILRCEDMLQEALSTIREVSEPTRSDPPRSSYRKETRSLSTSLSWYQAQPPSRARRMSVVANTPSSRGSWSSLFNAGSVRQFMAGTQNSPDAGSPGGTDGESSGRFPVPGALKIKEPSQALSQSPLKRGVAKSWSESSPRVQPNPSAIGVRGPTLPESPPAEKVVKPLNNKKLVVVLAVLDKSSVQQGCITGWREQMVMHVNAYAELLLRWQLLKQRGELLNSIKDKAKDSGEYRLGVSPQGDHRLPGAKSQPVRCTFCRLPIKGLSFACIRCGHVMHLKCRSASEHLVCAAGCGCMCGDGGLGSADGISYTVPHYF